MELMEQALREVEKESMGGGYTIDRRVACCGQSI